MAQYTAEDLQPLDPVKLSGAHLAERGDIFLLQYLSNCEAALKALPEVRPSSLYSPTLVDATCITGCNSVSSACIRASAIQASCRPCYGYCTSTKARPTYQKHHFKMFDTALHGRRFEELV